MRNRAFPLCVAPDQVMGFVEYLGSLGGVADVDGINRASGVDLELLPHALDAAEILGLVKQSSGYIVLTKLGKTMIGGVTRGTKRSLGDLLRDVEPFRTVLQRLGEAGALGRDDAMAILRERMHWESGEDVERLYRCLISWLLYAHLAEYDEEDVLRPARRSAS